MPQFPGDPLPPISRQVSTIEPQIGVSCDLWVIEEGVPIPVISAALFERFASRDGSDYADRLQSAMRKQFGGHDEKKSGS